MKITTADMLTWKQNNAVQIEQKTSNPTTNQTYTEDMDVDSLTTSLTMTMTNIKSKETEGDLLIIKLTTSPTKNMIPSSSKETEGNSLTDEPNRTMTTNATIKHEEDIEMEEPLTPDNINLFTITNTTLTHNNYTV